MKPLHLSSVDLEALARYRAGGSLDESNCQTLRVHLGLELHAQGATVERFSDDVLADLDILMSHPGIVAIQTPAPAPVQQAPPARGRNRDAGYDGYAGLSLEELASQKPAKCAGDLPPENQRDNTPGPHGLAGLSLQIFNHVRAHKTKLAAWRSAWAAAKAAQI
ncbi:MAG: hypothetical protein AB7J34_24935 [Limisphaerales bacterium]